MRHGIAAAVLLSAAAPVAAQDHWRWSLEPSFLAPSVDGVVTLPPSAPVSAGPADVFAHLQFGAMLTVEATRGVWTVSLDGYYTNLAQQADSASLTGQFQQGAIELVALRRVAPWAEVLLGIRVNFLGAGLEGTLGGSPVDTSTSVSWAEPIVGGRATAPGTGPWDLSLRADVGGFGLGSNLAWQVHPIVGYRTSPSFMVALGYRYASVDYENDDKQFAWDMATFGPEVRVQFRF